MYDFLSTLHTGMVWVLSITITLIFAWLVLGIVSKRTYGTLTRWIMLAFGGLLAAQLFIGITTLVARGAFGRWQFWAHALTMTVVVTLMVRHLTRLPSDYQKLYRRSLGVISSVLVLVIVGIVFLFVG